MGSSVFLFFGIWSKNILISEGEFKNMGYAKDVKYASPSWIGLCIQVCGLCQPCFRLH